MVEKGVLQHISALSENCGDKKMRMWLPLVLLAGCAYNGNTDFASSLDSWVGNSPTMLIEQWGTPNTQSAVNADTQIYTYMLQSNGGEQDPYQNQVVYSAIDAENVGTNSDENPIYYCQVSFIINNGVVSSYNFNGDNCVVDILPNN